MNERAGPLAGTGGLVLCGGRSRRMGVDKAGLRFPGGLLLERVLGRMARVAEPVVVSLAHGQAPPPLPPAVVAVQDADAERGPLWGLLQGFRALRGRARQVVVMPVDMPFLTPDWLARLVAELAGHRACLYRAEGFANALTAAYDLGLLDKLETLAAADRQRPLYLAEGEPTRLLEQDDHWRPADGPPPLMDVDTPEAYRAALLAEGVGTPGSAAVTLTWEAPPGVTVPGERFLALHAATGGDALAALGALCPELVPALARPASWLLRAAGAGWAPVGPADPLSEGDRLCVHWEP